MKKLIVAFTILCIACNTVETKKNKPNSDIAQEWVNTMEKYGISYKQLLSDTNTVYYACSSPFDTSLIVQLRKAGKKVNVLVYSLPSRYQRGLEGYRGEKDELTFLNGYSFALDSAIWKELTQQVAVVVNDTTLKPDNGCNDDARYFLSYQQHAVAGACKDSSFIRLSGYLKQQLLQPQERRRDSVVITF